MTIFFLLMLKSERSITAAPYKIFALTFFGGIDKGWNCGLVGVSITPGNRKCPKNRKLTEKQWEQPEDMIFLFSQICRIQTKNVVIIPEMMRSIWFWSQISINATKKEKKWHFLSRPIIFNVKVWFFSGSSCYRKWSKPLPMSTFVFVLEKSLGEYLVWGGRDGAPRFYHWKKKLVYPKKYWSQNLVRKLTSLSCISQFLFRTLRREL